MSGAHVFIDRSQFPENARRDLLESLRARAINHKFHYESYKQASKWLALHEAYSPARNDPSCQRIYGEAFAAAMRLLPDSERVHVIGLGCGGGQKETQLLKLLCESKRFLFYSPCDVSLPLVLAAREAATPFVDPARCFPFVCDLRSVEDLPKAPTDSARRVITVFGIIPNFEPVPLLCQIKRLLYPNDLLLLSANLTPGDDYAAGVRFVLPQYDNALTRDWLMTLLLDLGFTIEDGELAFSIETDAHRLQRIVAHFELKKAREIRVLGENVSYEPGERIRVFFSYRHTPETVSTLLREHSITVSGAWFNNSGEEGVFLCRKAQA